MEESQSRVLRNTKSGQKSKKKKEEFGISDLTREVTGLEPIEADDKRKTIERVMKSIINQSTIDGIKQPIRINSLERQGVVELLRFLVNDDKGYNIQNKIRKNSKLDDEEFEIIFRIYDEANRKVLKGKDLENYNYMLRIHKNEERESVYNEILEMFQSDMKLAFGINVYDVSVKELQEYKSIIQSELIPWREKVKRKSDSIELINSHMNQIGKDKHKNLTEQQMINLCKDIIILLQDNDKLQDLF